MTDNEQKTIPVIEGAGGLLPDYRALIVDLWGVVHNGKIAYEPAVAALSRYRREVGGTVALLSNAPRPAAAADALADKNCFSFFTLRSLTCKRVMGVSSGTYDTIHTIPMIIIHL